MMRKCGKKKLTRLVLAALLSTGGVLFSASSVEAVEVAAGEEVEYVYNDAKPTTDTPPTGTMGEMSDKTQTIDGIVKKDVAGGYTENANANNNKVFIREGATVGTQSGNNSIWGGKGDAADGNLIVITGATVYANIYGGSAATTSANDNTVIINTENTNGEFGYIHGGVGGTTANNNTVTILTKITAASLIGGEAASSENNTLNIGAVGVKTGQLNPHFGDPTNIPTTFQNMNFFLPAGTVKGDTMLTVDESESGFPGGLNLHDVTFGVAAQTGFNLAKDDTVNLIEYKGTGDFLADDTLKVADKATVLAEAEKINAIVPKSIVADEEYEFAVTKEDKKIVATVTNISEKKDDDDDADSPYPIADRKKSAVETRAAAVTLLNAGADMLASQGFSEAANAVAIEMAEAAKNGATGATAASGFTPFAAFGGSSLRAESGSHVDTKGFGLNVGFAREIANSQGKLLFGPVIEYGGGNYDSYNNNIHADGGSHYWGIGLMARQVNHDGFYYEGSLRGGRVKADYTERSTGLNSTYDSSSNYWAAHLGLGKVVAAGKSNTVDAYLKYFYSHQSGDDVTITSINPNAPVQANFDSVDSNRIRIGARLTHKVNEMNSFYGGLAYQYEFSGDARAHFNGEGAPSPSVKGSSGLLELGWQVKPGGPLMLDLGVTGWAGKQRGGSVQLGATWSF